MLEAQIEDFLLGLRIHPKLHSYALKLVERDEAEMARLTEVETRSVADALARNDVARRNLTRLRIADRITETEFDTERHQLERERFHLEGRTRELTRPDRFEPGTLCVLFSIRAVEWFREGDNQTKRTILEIAGSNPMLLDQKARIDASKLFRKWHNIDSLPAVRGVVQDVRTLGSTDEDARKALALLAKFSEILAVRDRPQVA